MSGVEICTRLDERLGSPLAKLEGRLSPCLRRGVSMLFVLTAAVDTLPTLLATAAAALFAMMAWVGGSTH
jgi:hypothetical protein